MDVLLFLELEEELGSLATAEELHTFSSSGGELLALMPDLFCKLEIWVPDTGPVLFLGNGASIR